ncbi:MAG: uracil-DNA glycosylase [Betaproteobacteria bacterium]|nr:MAG: uracil-DNA glycosylase [Betaproteobacteria bacterium]
MLEEMGLAPVWRVRRAADSGAAAVSTSADASAPSIEAVAPVLQPTGEKAASLAAASAPKAASHALADGLPPDEAQRRTTILQLDWTALKAAVAQCVACPLHAKRTNTVFGVGDERAQWLFVGEGPGAEEDAKGEPFVGQAGRLLDNMLAAIDLKRGENVYIANVVKCRPPSNRNPESGEMRCCEPYLSRQIELIRPKLIVALGKIAASHLLRTDASIASLRGRVHDYRGTPLIVTYHPAYLLRTLPDKAKSWADLCFARDTMRALASDDPEAAARPD